MRAINRLLRPRSVAIVGASPTPGSLGGGVLANLDRFGYQWPLHLVNPRYERIGERKCVHSIQELPDSVDCVLLAIGAAQVPDAVRECARKKVGGVIVLAGGFTEVGPEGRRAQEQIAATAKEAGMALQGPNCLGTINFVDGVPLMFGVAPRDSLGDRPGVAVVSQSGAMAAVIRVALQARGIGLSYCVSTGNEAALSAEDFLEELIADPHTRVVAMLMEQIRQPARFLELASKARAAGKSIVLHHLGRSAAGQAAAQTHTGALSGDHAVMAAQVRARGVYLVDSLELLIDVPELLIRFNNLRPPAGTVVVTESGAFKGMALDFCEAVHLSLPPLSEAAYAGLAKELPPFSPPSNPLDLTAQALVDPSLYQRVLSQVAEDPGYGSIAIVITLPSAESADRKLPPIIAALQAFGGRKAVVFAMLGEDCPIPAAQIDAIRATGTPFFRSPERAFRALSALTAAVPESPDTSVRVPVVSPLEGGTIAEYEAKQLLASLGVSMPPARFVVTVQEAVAAAKELGFPLALKAQSSALPHKSDAGGVALGIRDLDGLRTAWETMQQRLAVTRPELTLDGVLVERMSEEGIELIVGARNEGGWGPVILVGMGGVLAELLDDSTLIPAGVSRKEIRRSLGTLQGARLFAGYRGGPPADLESLIDIIAALGTLLLQHPEIVEMDLNPVRVHPKGATVLDALMVVRA